MGDILKEAIADAKAVRETALQNAKMALEEAFTPQLKNMLSAKLKEDEFGDEEEIPVTDEDEEFGDEEVPVTDEDEEMMGGEEVPPVTDEDEEMMGGEEVPAEETYEDEEAGEEEEGNLDLEAIIRELEDELEDEEPVHEQDDAYDEKANKSDKNDGIKSSDLAEQDDAYDDSASKEDKNDGKSNSTLAEDEDNDDDDTVEEEYEIRLEGDDDDDDEEELEEVDKSSGIGTGDNKSGDTDKSDGIGNGDNSLKEVKSELKEYKQAVHFLKNKLHEVNILNAKLLFTNKLFKSFSLNNNQKLKVVETFDRAQTTREIKLVYSTLAEQFNDNGSIVTRKSIKESASSAISSTKPSKGSRKVITEEAKVANRFKKLAGIIK
jgi:hypothetical protein